MIPRNVQGVQSRPQNLANEARYETGFDVIIYLRQCLFQDIFLRCSIVF